MKPKTQLPVYNLESNEYRLFEITSLVDLRKRDGDWPSTLPHRHSFYEILYIVGGKGRHFIDFKPYSLTRNTLYFISPGQVHFWQLESPPEGYAILFTEDFYLLSYSKKSIIHELSYFNGIDISPELQLKIEQVTSVKSIIQSMEAEYHDHNYGRLQILQAYLQILLIQVQRVYNMVNTQYCSSQESSMVRRFKQLVSERFDKEKSLKAYADWLNVSVGHLSNIVKTITGHSPGKIIRQEIILNAKRLLSHTNMTVAEIAYNLNFEDPSYFGRFFKRETKMSPIQFQRKIRKKCHISLK